MSEPGPPTAPNLGAGRATPRLANALGWSFLLNAGRRFTTTAVTFVLAGLLGPEAFGTVALAAIFVLLTQLLFQQGLSPVLVQRPRLDRVTANVAFRLVLLGSFLVAALTVLVAPLLGLAFRDQDLVPVLRVLTWILPLLALDLIQDVHLRRRSAFKVLALRTNISTAVGGVIGVSAAVLGAGVWALVLQQMVTAGLAVIILWARPEWTPSRLPRRWWAADGTRTLLRDGRRASAAAAAGFVGTQLDSIIVGAVFGVAAVGLYRLATRLVETVLDLGVRTFQHAALPDLARCLDAAAFRARALHLQRAACSVAMPPLGLLAAAAPGVTRVLGPDWTRATIPLVVLCLAALVTVLVTLITPMLQAQGAHADLARLNLKVVLAVGTGLLPIAWLVRNAPLAKQLNAIAGARAVVGVLLVCTVSLFVAARATSIPAGSMLNAAGPGAGGAVAAGGIGLSFQALAPQTWPQASIDLLSLALAGGAAVLVVGLLDRSLRKQVSRALSRRVAVPR